MSGMRRIVDGSFDARLDVRSGDELGELGEAFNTMGDMLARYKHEIEAWNRELQDRVDAKTRALEKAQAQLIQSSKMSALGHLGAGIAHELNNPLTGVVGQATLLKRRLARLELPPADRQRLLGYVEHVERESSRCREIIHGLLSFSQATAGGTDRVDVNDAIGRLLVLVQNNTRSAGVTLRQELSDGLPTVEANEQQLQQVLMHLLTNSLQAMPEGGEITIRTGRTPDGVTISVADTGRGIAPEHLDKVFDPFFTTKEVWQNTGLGLAVCYSIVESHGGRLEIESEVGRGTVVTVRLPRVSARPTGAARREEPVGLQRRRPVPAGA
jgi:signal transduction histidine kinase